MGGQGRAPASTNSMQRVKVYQLTDSGKWDDQGTGHVTVDYLERSEDLGLIVIDEEDNDTLLVHRISSDEIYRRQDDTIISWREPEFSTELALSFQEASGCSYIWDHICGVQRNMHFSTLSNLDVVPRPSLEALKCTDALHANDVSLHSVNNDLRELPTVELSNLPLILKTILDCGAADQMRVTELILQDQGFFPKLMDLFRMCEDLENMDGLHMIFRLVKGIILLNSNQIFDRVFADHVILDIIGSLEYDPDLPEIQPHRAFLKDHVLFKEVIPIKDPLVLSKVHQTYRIGYIKDVILPRVLDEGTTTSLNAIVHANNAVVVSLLKDDTSFIQELFARMKAPSIAAEPKKNLVLFLHEFCVLSKSLQLVQQVRLFRDLASEGIFDIITMILQSEDGNLISTGTDILILFLNQDPNLLRSFVIQQEGNAIFSLLVKGVITDFGEEMHCQFLEIIRILLDSFTLSGSQREALIEIFFEKHLEHLIDVITTSCSSKIGCSKNVNHVGTRTESSAAVKPEILSNICELLCFCVLHHPFRIKCNFLMNNAIEKVLRLTCRKEKFLVVAAVRFVRAIISRNDEHLLRHIVKNNLLKPVVDAFIENGNRYNMLHSGVLELLEYIRKENLKALIVYVVNTFWEQLTKFEHLGTIQAFKIKFDQSLAVCDTRSNIKIVDNCRRADERALEKEEEDYFNEDSDEEDSASARSSSARDHTVQSDMLNGTSSRYSSFRPVSGGLVDYDDDDEDDVSYNPPPRKSEAPDEGDGTVVATSFKSRRKSPSASKLNFRDEEAERTKKLRLDKHSVGNENSTGAGQCSACSRCKSLGGGEHCSLLDDASSHEASRDNDSNERSNNKSSTSPQICHKCKHGSVDSSRPSCGEDHQNIPSPVKSSSPEMVMNGATSEPYSVR